VKEEMNTVYEYRDPDSRILTLIHMICSSAVQNTVRAEIS